MQYHPAKARDGYMGKFRAHTKFRPTRRSGLYRYVIFALFLLALFYTLKGRSSTTIPIQLPHGPAGRPEYPPPGPGGNKPDSKPGSSTFSSSTSSHPIDKLIVDAEKEFNDLVSKESKTLEEAAQAYRQRRGRHPPPGFDKWWYFAQENSAIVVEDFFDQIYHDLEPFWGLDPAVIRKEGWSFEMKIHIRDHKCNTTSDWPWTLVWKDMLDSIAHLLPDMDIALNAMDEPRLVVPREQIDKYMAKASKTRGFASPKSVQSTFASLPAPGLGDKKTKIPDKEWEDTIPYWPVASRGCHPESRARQAEIQKTFDIVPEIDYSNADEHMYEGYVSNFTLSKDPCHQPDLQGLQGLFIEPLSTSASPVLFPMFGGSKLGINNEILLPPPAYWKEDEKFVGSHNEVTWAYKQSKAVWRGVATGGRNQIDNWRGFHRHRFVAMNNGTTVHRVEAGEKPENFALPSLQEYHLRAQEEKKLGDWINQWADAGFIELMCTPSQGDQKCYYTDFYFDKVEGMSMDQQFLNKYLPDIDGNSFSGRYRGFLQSMSLPIKATIWREWSDSRLVAWKHFVPMDNRFGDYYGIMDYFLGFDKQPGHDAQAEKMASDGKKWAERVLRREDMQLYTLRLLLEYGRVQDEGRVNMGWVGDVLKNPSLQKAWQSWQWPIKGKGGV